MSEIIFFALSTSIIIFSFNLNAMESSDLFSLQSIFSVVLMTCMLPLIFAYCYLAELVITNLYKIGNIFYDSPWYRLPAKQQIIVIYPIQRAGREYHFWILSVIDCSLYTFLSVWLFFI